MSESDNREQRSGESQPNERALVAAVPAEDLQAELVRRVEIAMRLELKIEKLVLLIKDPLDDVRESQLNHLLLDLYEFEEELLIDDSRKERGPRITIEGTVRQEAFIGFVVGVDRFLTWFGEFRSKLAVWQRSNWAYNKKYQSKFQSAASELRCFTWFADAVLRTGIHNCTKADIESSQRHLEKEKLRCQLADWSSQELIVEAVITDIRASLQKRIVSPIAPNKTESEEAGIYAKALELWNKGERWPEVAKSLGDTNVDALKVGTRRFAERHGLKIRKGSPGAPQKK